MKISPFVIAVSGLCVVMGGMLTSCTPKAKVEAGSILRLSQANKIRGLDPAFSEEVYSADEVSRGYEGLLQYHYLKRPYVLVPNLAESLPQVSPDGLTYTFKIKKGVLFHDDPCFVETKGKGRELVAQDFVYSLKRLADPQLLSPGWWILDEKVAGLNEWRAEAIKAGKADYSAEVAGLRALDRYTLEIRLLAARPVFLHKLTMPFSFVVPREAVEMYGKEFPLKVVGTGPFRLSEFSNNSKLVWVRNPTYRQEYYPAANEGALGDKELGLLEDAGKPIPFVDKVVVQVYEDYQPMWLNFLAGKLEKSFIPKDNFAQVITPGRDLNPELKQKGIRLWKQPLLDVTRITLNMNDPILGKNKLLRQALSLAYDADKFNEIFFDHKAVVAQGPIPPGLAGYDPTFKNPYREFNLRRSRELLAQAGFPDGKGLPVFKYLTQADSTSRQVADFDQRMFAAIGVKIKVETASFPEFLTAIRNGKAQLWPWAWNADYPDADNFLQLFYGKNGQGGANDAGYVNPEFDKLYEAAVGLPDGKERTELYRKMQLIVTEDCPWIFKNHRITFAVYQPWLKNYKFADFYGFSKYWRVEKHQ